MNKKRIELRNGKKVMLGAKVAKMMMKKFDAVERAKDRLKVQNAMNDKKAKKMTVKALKKITRGDNMSLRKQ